MELSKCSVCCCWLTVHDSALLTVPLALTDARTRFGTCMLNIFCSLGARIDARTQKSLLSPIVLSLDHPTYPTSVRVACARVRVGVLSCRSHRFWATSCRSWPPAWVKQSTSNGGGGDTGDGGKLVLAKGIFAASSPPSTATAGSQV